MLTQYNKSDSEKIYKQINNKSSPEKSFNNNLLDLANMGDKKGFFTDVNNFKSAFFCEEDKHSKIDRNDNLEIEELNKEKDVHPGIKPLHSSLAATLLRIADWQQKNSKASSFIQTILIDNNTPSLQKGLILLALHQAVDVTRANAEKRPRISGAAPEEKRLKKEFSGNITEVNIKYIVELLSTPEFGRGNKGLYHDAAPMLSLVKDPKVSKLLTRANIVKIFKKNPFMHEDIALHLLKSLKERDVLEILYHCHENNRFTVGKGTLAVIENQNYAHFDFQRIDEEKGFSKVMQAMVNKVKVAHLPHYFDKQKEDASQQSVILTIKMAKHQIQEDYRKKHPIRHFFANLFSTAKADEVGFIGKEENYAVAKQVFKKTPVLDENNEIVEKLEDKSKLHKIQTDKGAYMTIGGKLRGHKKIDDTKKMFKVDTLGNVNLSLDNEKNIKQQYAVKEDKENTHKIMDLDQLDPEKKQRKSGVDKIVKMRKSEKDKSEQSFFKAKKNAPDEDFAPIKSSIVDESNNKLDK